MGRKVYSGLVALHPYLEDDARVPESREFDPGEISERRVSVAAYNEAETRERIIRSYINNPGAYTKRIPKQLQGGKYDREITIENLIIERELP